MINNLYVKNNYLKFGLVLNSSLNVFTNLPQIGGEIINLTYTPTPIILYFVYCFVRIYHSPHQSYILFNVILT